MEGGSSCEVAEVLEFDGEVHVVHHDLFWNMQHNRREIHDARYAALYEGLCDFLRRGRGRAIVNVSSINYRLGVPKRSIYSATKAGILGLTTGLARELGAEGIRLNTVTPGWIFTERQVGEYFVGPKAEKHLAYLAGVQSLPLKISATDVANHILFYLSDVSRASTGHNCVVDGGWLLE